MLAFDLENEMNSRQSPLSIYSLIPAVMIIATDYSTAEKVGQCNL